jgi:hypothetical protein
MQPTADTQPQSPWHARGWHYRKRITVDRTMVAGTATLNDLPVLICLAHPALRTAQLGSGPVSSQGGGHVAHADGADLHFVTADGAPLAAEIQRYVPTTGELRAWVKLPELPAEADSVIYLYYGNSEAHHTEGPSGVWDAGYRLVLHVDPAHEQQRDSSAYGHAGRMQRTEGCGDHISVSHAAGLDIAEAITVEAWVAAEDKRRADAVQSLVSKWRLLPAFDTFNAYDAGHTDGLQTQGFFGAVFDGRYVYFSPAFDGSVNHGRVLRYDTHGHFDDPVSWSAYDAGDTSGLRTRGYYGAVYDGRYVTFVPRLDRNFTPEVEHHSRILRYDTRGEFKEPTSWRAHDAGDRVSHQSAAFDGRYAYFCPGYEHFQHPAEAAQSTQWGNVAPTRPASVRGSGRFLRYDTHGDFDDPTSYVCYDASHTSGLVTKCYDGAIFDGRYVYFVPLESMNVVLRYDTQADYCHPDSWVAFDAAAALGLHRGWAVGAIFDGRYVYIVPYSDGVVVRYDTRGNFLDAGSWQTYDAGATGGLDSKGYDGAVFDGKYVYFIPFYRGRDLKTDFHACVLRYDTACDFHDPLAWAAHDAEGVDGVRAVGFNGGTFDGRFMYCSPWRDGVKDDGLPSAHGRVLRYDTTGSGASFSLRYDDCGHNGGLTAALPGPTFLVNTERGALNARASRTLRPGWHHLAGVYDGRQVSLVIDGELAGRRDGSGRIQTCDADVFIGRIQDGLGHFGGRILEVRISNTARSLDWLRSEYRNLNENARYVRIGEEECDTDR